MKRLLLVMIMVFSTIGCCQGQWPLGQGFYAKMLRLRYKLNQMAANMRAMQDNMAANMRATQDNMAANMHAMQERMASQQQLTQDRGQYISRRYGPGFNSFTTATGGTGYVYNSPDGSVNMYSYNSGPQRSGYVYQSGPEGTFFRQW